MSYTVGADYNSLQQLKCSVVLGTGMSRLGTWQLHNQATGPAGSGIFATQLNLLQLLMSTGNSLARGQ